MCPVKGRKRGDDAGARSMMALSVTENRGAAGGPRLAAGLLRGLVEAQKWWK